MTDRKDWVLLGVILGSWARQAGTDPAFLKILRTWIILVAVLFVIFSPLAYVMTKGFQTLFGALYLFSLFMVFFVTIRLRQTIDAAGQKTARA